MADDTRDDNAMLMGDDMGDDATRDDLDARATDDDMGDTV